MPTAIDSQSGTDSTSDDEQPARAPDRAESGRELLRDAREQAGERRRQHVLETRQRLAEACRIAGQDEQHAERRHARPPPPFRRPT